MKIFPRLRAEQEVRDDVQMPGYDRETIGPGIVHLGIGNFHRAHQAVYTDDAIAACGGDWRIIGVSLRSKQVADQLNPQDGLYTVLERSSAGTVARVVGSIYKVLYCPTDRSAIFDALTAKATSIVSLTVSEKAYGIDRSTLSIDKNSEVICGDLKSPRNPTGVLGLLVEGLRRRWENETVPFTVLCCDNLPENGKLLRAGVIDFAEQIDTNLSKWISEEVHFPSTMVDRITPASTDTTRNLASSITGCADHAAIETEPFRQWVIEDQFYAGRPRWEEGGAIFVANVLPYELMKLRMLNGVHSMLAYVGHSVGCTYIRNAMDLPELALIADHHMQVVQRSLPELKGICLDHYRSQLLARFANPAIDHRTEQIAMDGTEKLPQRILDPAVETMRQNGDIGPFSFAIAAWMFFCWNKVRFSPEKALNDPRESEIRLLLEKTRDADQVSAALHGLNGVFPDVLRDNTSWRKDVMEGLDIMLRSGMNVAVAKKFEQIKDVLETKKV